jgi:hypothetical protein
MTIERTREDARNSLIIFIFVAFRLTRWIFTGSRFGAQARLATLPP